MTTVPSDHLSVFVDLCVVVQVCVRQAELQKTTLSLTANTTIFEEATQL